MRSHILKPITDGQGALIYNASVMLLDPVTGGPLTQSAYLTAATSIPLSNPFVAPLGVIDIYLVQPERIRCLISAPNKPSVDIIVDAQPDPGSIILTASGLSVLNDSAASRILVGIDAVTAQWVAQPVPVDAPVHYHPGTGDGSTALGTSAVATGSGSTAVGDDAAATAEKATAYGQGASASSTLTTAIGAGAHASMDQASAVGALAFATGQGSVAIGVSAGSSGSHSSAVGATSSALGDNATALGYAAIAYGASSTAVGDHASATAVNSAAFGVGATASHSGAVAIGPNVVTSAVNQIALGSTTHTVLVTGTTGVVGDVALAGPASTLGFFGVPGAVKGTVTGSRGGSVPLAALLTYLADLGLIIDSSTA